MQSAVAETDALGQVEESASQTGEVLAHRAAKTGKVRLDEGTDGGVEFAVLLHH